MVFKKINFLVLFFLAEFVAPHALFVYVTQLNTVAGFLCACVSECVVNYFLRARVSESLSLRFASLVLAPLGKLACSVSKSVIANKKKRCSLLFFVVGMEPY